MSSQDPAPAEASAAPVSTALPGAVTVVDKGPAFRASRKIWGWIVAVSSIVAVLSLVISFYFTLHYFSSAGHAMALAMGEPPGGLDGYEIPAPRRPPLQSESARSAMHSHTVSAVVSLSVGLTVFVGATVLFLGALAQYLSLRARSNALSAPAVSASAESAEPSDADASRFTALLNRPAGDREKEESV